MRSLASCMSGNPGRPCVCLPSYGANPPVPSSHQPHGRSTCYGAPQAWVCIFCLLVCTLAKFLYLSQASVSASVIWESSPFPTGWLNGLLGTIYIRYLMRYLCLAHSRWTGNGFSFYYDKWIIVIKTTAVFVNWLLLKGSLDFPGGSVVKNLPASAGDTGSIPRLERSSAEGNGNPFQYSCLGNPMDRGA